MRRRSRAGKPSELPIVFEVSVCTDDVKDRLSSREVLRGGMRRADVDTRVMNRQAANEL